MDIVVIGLSLSSSWGNGHATTYRGLLRGLHALGHRVLFLEREVEWYRSHRDLPHPDFCELALYDSVDELIETYGARLRRADAVIVGSYVPEGIRVINAIAALHPHRFCFYDIDTPVTLAKLASAADEYIAKRQIPLFDAYLSFTGGPTLRRLEVEFGARLASELYCSVDADRYRATGEATEWDLGYLGTYSSDRQPALERLLLEPARRIARPPVRGGRPAVPERTSDWPANVQRIDHLPPSAHPSFYSRQRFTLNVTRADMIAAGWSPSVRLFEAAACGTPIISDEWAGLTELLPEGDALLIARSTADVVAALTLLDDAGRQAIGEAARGRVLLQHTGLARARQLVRLLTGLDNRNTAGTSPAKRQINIEEGAIG